MAWHNKQKSISPIEIPDILADKLFQGVIKGGLQAINLPHMTVTDQGQIATTAKAEGEIGANLTFFILAPVIGIIHGDIPYPLPNIANDVVGTADEDRAFANGAVVMDGEVVAP